MPPARLPVVGWRKVLRALSKKGFYVVHQRGSHIYLTDSDRKHRVTVPRHDPLKPGTLLSIIEQSGLRREAFLELLE